MTQRQEKTEIVSIRLPLGTQDEIFEVLYGGEVRSAFMRYAILSELERRRKNNAGAPAEKQRYTRRASS
jgi:hypothetical protein